MQRTIIECVKPLFEESLKGQSLPPKDAEIFLRQDGTIEIPGDRLPIFKINNNILSRLQYMNAEDREYIREKVKAGKFLIRSITQRQSTLYKVSVAIVNYQKTFLTTYNVHDLKPLTMAQIALECEIHETTVSRAVNNKYLSTPKGTFELRFFFTFAGDRIAALTIRQ